MIHIAYGYGLREQTKIRYKFIFNLFMGGLGDDHQTTGLEIRGQDSKQHRSNTSSIVCHGYIG